MNKINFGIVHLSVVPGRAEPSHRSEQVTQVLFGETFKVLRSEQDWHFIKIDYDAYECWIDGNQFVPLAEDHYHEYLKKSNFLNTQIFTTIKLQGDSSLQLIGIGANFPFYSGKHFKIGDNIYEVEHPPEDNLNTQASEARIVAIAESLLNTTYLWGGKSIMGIDCSGFTQLVFKCLGIKLPRDAYQQADMGYTLSFVAEARTGDLAFFDNDEGKIVHVGIVHGSDKIIHASGKVRIDRLDHQGIFNEDSGRYTHKLRLIKRII
ncbi:MAG: NlpC/P60 family protein [Flavobacteriales bacterium]